MQSECFGSTEEGTVTVYLLGGREKGGERQQSPNRPGSIGLIGWTITAQYLPVGRSVGRSIGRIAGVGKVLSYTGRFTAVLPPVPGPARQFWGLRAQSQKTNVSTAMPKPTSLSAGAVYGSH
jgi:hypothetical protein